MSDWKEYKLGDLISSISETFKFTKDEVVFLNTSDIYMGKILNHNLFNPINLPGQAKKKIRRGDLLFSEIRPANGRYALIKDEVNNYVVSTKLMVLRCSEKILPEYLNFYLTSTEMLNYLQMIAEDRSGTFPQITFDNLAVLKLLLPPLAEQKAIAEVLSSLDDKIELLHRQNKTLEQLAETLFRQWFMEEADDTWEKTTFGDIVIPKKGKNLKKTEAIYGIYPVVAGGLEPSCYHNIANTKSPVVTISSSGANAGFVRLYHVPVWSSDSCYIDETITKYIYFSYVFLRINQKKLTDKQEGSAQPHIYPSHIMELDMLHFPNKLIEKFETEVTPLYSKIKSKFHQLEHLISLKEFLLQKLMYGELKINRIDYEV